MTEIIPVEVLGENQQGRIVELVGPPSWRHRLEEMGLRPGVEITLLRRGRPCIIALDGQRLSLRGDAETMVLVEPVPAEVPACHLSC